MSDKSKTNMFNDLLKGALTTAISVLVTYYVTSAIKTDQHQQNDSEKEKQRTEALEKTNVILSSYISRYDSLHTKYLALLESKNSRASFNRSEDIENSQLGDVIEKDPSTSFNKVSALLINGNWVTPDGTVQWVFNNGQVRVSGVGSYIGFIEGQGRYDASNGEIDGTVHISKAYYLATNESLRFTFKISSDNRTMYGSNTDNAGVVNAMTLYKNN
ncbi:MAG TPA: hypothetical protein VFL70_02860 [Bacteroidia bacterium]|nr:hypothetical protein [Bacteroidia bacterium]